MVVERLNNYVWKLGIHSQHKKLLMIDSAISTVKEWWKDAFMFWKDVRYFIDRQLFDDDIQFCLKIFLTIYLVYHGLTS